MSRFRAFMAVAALIGISVLTACATPPNSYGSASVYVPGDSMNRACRDGFRPNDGRSCSY